MSRLSKRLKPICPTECSNSIGMYRQSFNRAYQRAGYMHLNQAEMAQWLEKMLAWLGKNELYVL